MEHQARRTAPTRGVIAAYGALVVVIGAVWANSVSGGPIFDDHFLADRQTCFRSLRGLLRILQFEPTYACTYRPARYVSYGVDSALFGGAFWGFHVGNIARHAVSAVLAGLLATRLFAQADGCGSPRVAHRWFGLAVAALWALHPVHTDSVSYVSGRRDILVGAWTLASLLAALHAQRRGGLWWLAPLWTTLFAFMSKESAVVIPVLYVAWVWRDADPRTWVREHLATTTAVGVGLGLSFLLVLYRGVFESHSNRGFEWWGGSLESNFATVATLQLRYIGHVASVLPLIGDYKEATIPLATGFGDPRALCGVALVLALVLGALRARRREPLVFYGIAFYLVSLAPMSHVFPHHELFAEHYLYLPIFGAALVVVAGARWLFVRVGVAPSIGVVALVAVVAAFSTRVVARNRDFANEETYYRHVVEHAPANVRAVANLANIYFDQEEFAAALPLYQRLADAWIPGSGNERTHVRRELLSAREVGDDAAGLTAARRLAERHPEVGIGHRHVAELLHDSGDYVGGFAAARRWWETTASPGALAVMAHAASATPTVPLEEVSWLAETVAEALEPPEVAIAYTAQALALRGEAAAALDLMRAMRRPGLSADYDDLGCRIAGRAGVASSPVWCSPEAPDPVPDNPNHRPSPIDQDGADD